MKVQGPRQEEELSSVPAPTQAGSGLRGGKNTNKETDLRNRKSNLKLSEIGKGQTRKEPTVAREENREV